MENAIEYNTDSDYQKTHGNTQLMNHFRGTLEQFALWIDFEILHGQDRNLSNMDCAIHKTHEIFAAFKRLLIMITII